MATATMTKKVVKDKEVEAIIKNVQENKKKQDIKTPYKYTSAKELEKLFNLKNKQKYPILFTKVNGMEVAKERKNGEIHLNCRVESVTEYDNSNIKKRVSLLVPLSTELLEYIFDNSNNPRDAVYSTKRQDILLNLYRYYRDFHEMNQGVTISASNINVPDSMDYIDFEIAHMDARFEGDSEAEEFNKRNGMYDGQNLWYLILTFIDAVKNGVLEIEGKLEDRYVRIVLQEFREDVSLDDLVRIYSAKNNSVAQSDRNLEVFKGTFDDILPECLMHGVERKENSKHYDLWYTNYKEEEDNMSSEEMIACTPQKPDVSQVAKELDVVYTSAHRSRAYVFSEENGLWDAKGKDLIRQKLNCIVEVPKSARSKFGAANSYIKFKEEDGYDLRYSCVREEVIAKLYTTYRDAFLSYDFSKIDAELRKTLGIVETTEYIVSPFTHKIITYTLPVYVSNIIPETFGFLCTLDTVNDKLNYSNLDIEAFLDKNMSAILTDMAKSKTILAKDGHDTYGFASDNVEGLKFHEKLLKKCLTAKKNGKKMKCIPIDTKKVYKKVSESK